MDSLTNGIPLIGGKYAFGLRAGIDGGKGKKCG